MLKRLVAALQWRLDGLFDRRHGVDTTGITHLSALQIDSPHVEHGVFYEATPERIFNAAIESLAIDHTQFRFVDLGSGKGRTLLMASRWPFAEVIGVEFSEQLHRVAQQNIAASAGAAARQVRSVHADAARYTVPAGDTLLYLFNPFDETVLAPVLTRLAPLAAAHRLVIVYCQARCHATVLQSGLVRHMHDVPLPRVWSRPRNWIWNVRVYANFELAAGVQAAG